MANASPNMRGRYSRRLRGRGSRREGSMPAPEMIGERATPGQWRASLHATAVGGKDNYERRLPGGEVVVQQVPVMALW
jgi:hypothetical protein